MQTELGVQLCSNNRCHPLNHMFSSEHQDENKL